MAARNAANCGRRGMADRGVAIYGRRGMAVRGVAICGSRGMAARSVAFCGRRRMAARAAGICTCGRRGMAARGATSLLESFLTEGPGLPPRKDDFLSQVDAQIMPMEWNQLVDNIVDNIYSGKYLIRF
jgi:hypothetical protein